MDYSSKEYFDKMTAWWRAANYLSVGQIYLKDNPLLRRTLKPEDVKNIQSVIGERFLAKILFMSI
mgnify:CR=1 FL=1